jgi:hypothetical protein
MFMPRSLSRFVTVVLVIGYAAGCQGSSEGTLHGRVTLNGQPVASGAITFTPVDGQTATASCLIKDGQYTARVPVAKHKVTITSPQAEKGAKTPASTLEDGPAVHETIPEKYNTKTELMVEVQPGTHEHAFDLEK